MNRTDRLLAIVLELQRKGQQRAEDLAASFEVSVRTIYRDVQALLEIGIPIISMTGNGYTLDEGYFLPPLRFSPDEAFMLILGSDVMTQHFDAQYRLAAQSARQKIETILSDKVRHLLDDLQESIGFIKANPDDNPAEMQYLPLLRRAIIERRTVRLHYRTHFEGSEPNHLLPRDIEPYGVKRHGEAWYLIGFCLASRGVRNFRLSRIQQLSVLTKTFTRPASFTFSTNVQNTSPENRTLIIRVLFDPEAADWLPETRSFYIISEIPYRDGLLVTLKVRHERDVMPWLLSWGSHIEVLEPASLRQLLVEEAKKVQRHHQGDPDPY
jgi:predicted DNA-binding transcriptional regulator YafY